MGLLMLNLGCGISCLEFFVTFLSHPRWRLGRYIAVGYKCFIFQFLDIVIVLPHHVLYSFCTASLNMCHIELKVRLVWKIIYFLYHVSCDSCLQILYETFFFVCEQFQTQRMMRNFEIISDKFNVMVICTCGICVQNKSLNCIIIIL